ncbi:hypothetical protein ACVW0I_004995 [Bradyrhizobium sp. LM6.11]
MADDDALVLALIVDFDDGGIGGDVRAATGSGWWKVMSRSPSTTITRLRFISPGPAPHAATEANVGTTLSGRGVNVPSLTKASSFSSIGSAPRPMP